MMRDLLHCLAVPALGRSFRNSSIQVLGVLDGALGFGRVSAGAVPNPLQDVLRLAEREGPLSAACQPGWIPMQWIGPKRSEPEESNP